MTKEQVDEIGQGRVWSGENAKENGLIDEFGGLKMQLIWLPKLKVWMVIAPFRCRICPIHLKNFLKPDPIKLVLKFCKTNWVKNTGSMNFSKKPDLKGIYARLPYDIFVN